MNYEYKLVKISSFASLHFFLLGDILRQYGAHSVFHKRTFEVKTTKITE